MVITVKQSTISRNRDKINIPNNIYMTADFPGLVQALQ